MLESAEHANSRVPRIRAFLARMTGRGMRLIGWLTLFLFFLWAAGAIWYFTLLPRMIAVSLACGYVVTACVAFFRMADRSQWLKRIIASVLVVYFLTLLQRPSNDRNWAADNDRQPLVNFGSDSVRIDGFRHSVYRSESDFDVRYGSFDFPINKLDKVWFVVQRFTALEGIAHNFLTFRVKHDDRVRYFSVSVEIRREEGESFSPVLGLYRQYELIYVIADERDEIGARTVMRPDDRVFMYPVNATPEQVQQLFVSIAARIDQLRSRPEFYHSLLNNCTNSIVLHTFGLTSEPINRLDLRIVLPGYADRFAWANQLIGDDGQPFETLKQKCRIDRIARKVGITESFSADIRSELPE